GRGALEEVLLLDVAGVDELLKITVAAKRVGNVNAVRGPRRRRTHRAARRGDRSGDRWIRYCPRGRNADHYDRAQRPERTKASHRSSPAAFTRGKVTRRGGQRGGDRGGSDSEAHGARSIHFCTQSHRRTLYRRHKRAAAICPTATQTEAGSPGVGVPLAHATA